MVKIPDSVLQAYAQHFAEYQPKDTLDVPSGTMIGRTPRGDAWRLEDGWGERYFVDPPTGDAIYVCQKMPDVMAWDCAAEFGDKIDRKKVKDLGMGDKAWDAAVLAALGDKTT